MGLAADAVEAECSDCDYSLDFPSKERRARKGWNMFIFEQALLVVVDKNAV